jgi:hypothetical protein
VVTDEAARRAYAALWLAELGATVPEAYGGVPWREPRRPDELRHEFPGVIAPDPTRARGRE